jgi:APA family basic amino acid/polyamine antiporter
MYLPMLVQWMRKAKGESVLRRFIMPALAICGSLFMIFACAISHKWSCIWYLIVFAVIMTLGMLVNRSGKTGNL